MQIPTITKSTMGIIFAKMFKVGNFRQKKENRLPKKTEVGCSFSMMTENSRRNGSRLLFSLMTKNTKNYSLRRKRRKRSASTPQKASPKILPLILEVPAVRSRKMMESSLTLKPNFQAVYFISIWNP